MKKILPTDGVDKFLSRRPIFRARNFTYAPDQARKKVGPQIQSARLIKTKLKTLIFVLYYLSSTNNFHF